MSRLAAIIESWPAIIAGNVIAYGILALRVGGSI